MSDEPQIEQTETEAIEAQLATLRAHSDGSPTGDTFVISNHAVIGRNDPTVGPVDIDLTSLSGGEFVSRRHAEISFEDGHWLIRDLGSSNKTFVQEQDKDLAPIEADTELSDGQFLSFGNARFSFHLGAEEKPQTIEETDIEEPTEP